LLAMICTEVCSLSRFFGARFLSIREQLELW
jgi:hypothetical protein